jgi:hypothetical protein
MKYNSDLNRTLFPAETYTFLMGLPLTQAVRSVENKTDDRDKRKMREKEKILFGFSLFNLSDVMLE